MSYERLAFIYDLLMADVPYKQWLQFFQREIAAYNIKGNRVLDIGCGTGEFTIMLAKNGYEVTGVDISTEMLMVAREKAERNGVHLPLFEQNMAELEGLGSFDIATIFCDSLNYLSSPEDVQQTFQRVYNHLNTDGLLLFDVHSPYKIEKVFINETFTLVEDDVAYIWECFPGETKYSVEHELTFFVKENETEKYERFEEIHVQRTYDEEQFREWLTGAGFDVLRVTADFTDQAPHPTAERLFFTCQKK